VVRGANRVRGTLTVVEDYVCVAALCASGLAWFAVMAVLATFANRAIGRGYEAKAARLRARIAARIVKEARGVPMRVLATNALSFRYRWANASVWLTPTALYIAPTVRLFGKPMGQPILGVAFDEANDKIEDVDLVLRPLGRPSVDERGRLHIVTTTDRAFLRTKFRIRLELPAASGWLDERASVEKSSKA
jgi:hypothetical protein